MTIALCVDDRYGMMFNRRRQSKDSLLRKRLLEHVNGNKLWMNSYSATQFQPLPENVVVDEAFLQKAEKRDVCFLEGQISEQFPYDCERLILYSWNRKYPADTYFPAEILMSWKLKYSCDFEGSSHDQITERIYEKK